MPQRRHKGNPKQLPCSERHCDSLSAFTIRKLYKQNGYSKILLHALKKKKIKQGECAGGLARGYFLPKKPKFCHLLWHLNSCWQSKSCRFCLQPRCQAVSTPSFFRKCFESSKALFKRFSSHCSTVRRLIN